jgi:hypothetical protein
MGGSKSHWERVFEEYIVFLTSLSLSLSLPSFCLSQGLSHASHHNVCLTTGPDTMELGDHGMKSLKL